MRNREEDIEIMRGEESRGKYDQSPKVD